MKLLRNKSKNRNVENCPLKNKTPRGKRLKKKEMEGVVLNKKTNEKTK